VDLNIPGPSEAVPHKPASVEQIAQAKAAKQKKGPPKPAPKPTGAITTRYVPRYLSTVVASDVYYYRNLFLADFHREHGNNATAEDFTKAWKGISKEKLQVVIICHFPTGLL